MLRWTVFLPLLLCACALSHSGKPEPRAERGVLDLRGWSFQKDGPLNLEGEWEFYWNRLLSSDDIHQQDDLAPSLIRLPSYWKGRIEDGKALPGQGFATFRLRVLLPKGQHRLALYTTDVLTSHRTLVNGSVVTSNGAIGTSAQQSRAQYLPLLSEAETLQGEAEIIVQVSNFQHRLGGIWSTPRLGLSSHLGSERDRRRDLELFLLGALLIMGIYHMTLFALRHKDRSALYFGLFCLVIVVRLTTTGERYLIALFPNGPFELFSKLEYVSYMSAPPLFAMFTHSLFSTHFNRRVLLVIQIVGLAFCSLVAMTTVSIYSYSVTAYYLLMILGCLYAIWVAARAAFYREDGALLFLGGFAAVFATLINDILYNELIIRSAYLTPFGLWLFVFAQAALLAGRFAGAFQRVETLSTSFERFVPRDVLQHLGRESISDVQLGDAVQKDMTILFSDLRNFSTLSETMEPSENFSFLNAVYRRVSPVIRRNNGFIDKYIGDGIMALFPQQAGDAVRAAMAMQRLVEDYNQHRIAQGYQAISTGFGIHSGKLILGTVGEPERMDSTVISDAVNLASRLEGISKVLGVRIVISQSVRETLTAEFDAWVRPLGRIRVRGKSQPVAVFEVFGAGSPASVANKNRTLTLFEGGLRSYHEHCFREAADSFRAVLDQDATDVPARHYLAESLKLAETQPAANWDGSFATGSS